MATKKSRKLDHNASVVKLTTFTVVKAQWGWMDGDTFVPRGTTYNVSNHTSESYHAEDKPFVEVCSG